MNEPQAPVVASNELFGAGIVLPKVKAERLCFHPNMLPTRWNQPQPAPCVVVELCECGANYYCPVCTAGSGQWPCACGNKSPNPSRLGTTAMNNHKTEETSHE